MPDVPNSQRQIMFVSRRAPYGTVYGHEMLEAMLAGSVFGERFSAVFIDDGVFQLMSNQNSSELDIKQYTKAFQALPDFEISTLFVEQESLEARGLTSADLMEIVDDSGVSAITLVSTETLANLMNRQDVIVQL